MGVSDGEEGGGVVDAAVGTIVWVRRRNGSWWPGRILGAEELSSSHLMSPRSGTPVKFLGREDASVDWYNLEKSKRVKPFRCGEFDACIERAEASHRTPIKKREKYARREDAILHALELEKQQQIEMKPQELGSISNCTTNRNYDAHRRELHSLSSDIYTMNDYKYSNHESHSISRKSVLSGEEKINDNNLCAHKGKPNKRFVLDENNDESFPRMRGLQDFGLKIVPPKKKFSESLSWEFSHKPVDINIDTLPNMGYMICDPSPTGSSKSSLSVKRKRSQGGYAEDSLVKKRDRRRPLVQVLQNSEKIPVSPSFQSEYDGGILLQGERDLMGVASGGKRSRCVYLNADSNDLLDDDGYSCGEIPDTSMQLGIVDPLDCASLLAAGHSSSSLAEETESDSSETDYLERDLEEDGNVTDTTQTLVPGSKYCEPPEVQIPENIRYPDDNEMPSPASIPPLHHQDPMMDASADAGVSKWHMKGKRNIRNLTKRPNMDLTNGKISSNVDKHNGRYGNWRYPFPLQRAKNSGRSHSSFIDSENDECFDPGDEMESLLIDVNIEVQKRSYQGKHVPWVSLSSKWNGGKPILGHPVQIEILEDSSIYDAGADESHVPPAFMRTAKRSLMHRIPHSKTEKSKFQQKALKRVGVSPNQKTRTLSSLATEKKFSRRSNVLGGLIKPDGGVPLVTCVPIKVVFSRILESISRPALGLVHRA